jgi:hypothetical protein
MMPFEYIALLASIVIALGLTRILTGLGKVLQLRDATRIYWVHIVWTVNVLLWLLLNWWILYRWRTFEAWTFFLFLFVLVSPTVAFLLSVLLLPEPLESEPDLKRYFYQNRRWFFSLAALLPPVDAIDTLLKGKAHFLAQGPLYIVTVSLLFVLCVTGVFVEDERFHAAFSAFFLLYILAFIAINLRLLV